MIKKGLGRGLGALISSEEEYEVGKRELRLNEIEPNINQVRKNFNDEKLLQLSESIKQHGVVQPIIVRKENDIYKIVAGERRWRAARMAGLTSIPVIIRELTNKQLMEISLIENLQREDLNPIEEAEAYEHLVNEYKMTQDEISKAVGKSRPVITNSLRLLNLNDNIKNYIVNGLISSGHARALLSIDDKEKQNHAAEEISKKELSVREAEKLVKKYISSHLKKKEIKNEEIYKDIVEKLQVVFSTKVCIFPNKKRGKIVIEYYSDDELERILELINLIKQNK